MPDLDLPKVGVRMTLPKATHTNLTRIAEAIGDGGMDTVCTAICNMSMQFFPLIYDHFHRMMVFDRDAEVVEVFNLYKLGKEDDPATSGDSKKEGLVEFTIELPHEVDQEVDELCERVAIDQTLFWQAGLYLVVTNVQALCDGNLFGSIDTDNNLYEVKNPAFIGHEEKLARCVLV